MIPPAGDTTGTWYDLSQEPDPPAGAGVGRTWKTVFIVLWVAAALLVYAILLTIALPQP
jgi:hypothetical protein